MEKSLHVLTLTIADVKQPLAGGNMQMASEPLRLLEVYGIVDSATGKESTSCKKTFMLRDETGTIGCIFFEIDRQLPRLTRGQWYRCMGTLQSPGVLQCLSVRPASQVERNKARPLLVTASLRTARDMSTVFHEQ